MNKIEVAVLAEAHESPAGMMMFLARLTQRGHNIKCMEDLLKLYENSMALHKGASAVAKLPHGTIKRFTPITVAIVGASRRFLAQARTHQVGITYVSASLQYSDYSGAADFVVPYSLMGTQAESLYLESCENAMVTYQYIAKTTDNDTAGYAAPQGLRNILIIQANHEAWMHFIRLRGCNRNTVETQYVTMRIWEKLLETADGKDMFKWAGPDCLYGVCREGKMSCKDSLAWATKTVKDSTLSIPAAIIGHKWPLLSDASTLGRLSECNFASALENPTAAIAESVVVEAPVTAPVNPPLESIAASIQDAVNKRYINGCGR